MQELAGNVIELAKAKGIMLASAESLTGGMVVSSLVGIPGASAVVAGGACTYSFAAKAKLLGLDLAELERLGAVRPTVANAMALGALDLYEADLALATTGVAGPGPDAYGNPAGKVFVAVAVRNTAAQPQVEALELQLTGERPEIRLASVQAVLELGLKTLSELA